MSRGNLFCPFDRSRITGRKDVKLRSKKVEENVSKDSRQNIELSVLGINSTTFLAKKEEQEVKTRKANEKVSSPVSYGNGRIDDINELFIYGAVRT